MDRSQKDKRTGHRSQQDKRTGHRSHQDKRTGHRSQQDMFRTRPVPREPSSTECPHDCASSPPRGPAGGGAIIWSLSLVLDLAGDAVVHQSDLPTSCQQDVATLHVAVQHTTLLGEWRQDQGEQNLEVYQRMQNILDDVSDLILIDSSPPGLDYTGADTWLGRLTSPPALSRGLPPSPRSRAPWRARCGGHTWEQRLHSKRSTSYPQC